ncbi:DNA polymerase III subunit delta' [Corynebacterium sp. sy017]|uniref:DNA polymerase III subunit delta' n=1 Tax=Corynebacterium sp. SY003 TaxID=2499164 RepID=UPI001186026D|nr:DNA polymerase III subunit delta' [Corynebacterium sp. sy017]MBP3089374.1 DNA polymerase III subunit delta' [Corynebacterium sp. sy017]TSD91109.1 DNA polymerase III subunit delta' [Corynebacterium sp. SY003]
MESVNDVFSQWGVSEHVAVRLRAAAQAAREKQQGSAMTHSWLFTGSPGSGRSTAALAFAAALECEHPSIIGCGQCAQCTAVHARTHGDVFFMEPRELIVSVKTVREEIVAPVATKPMVAPWRVVIVDNADRLNDQAANALLKTFEEPPAHAVIILCAPSTDPEDVIPTLVSRSRHVYIPQPTAAEVAQLLIGEGVPENHAHLAAVATGSHIGRARRLVHDEQAQRRRVSILNLAELVSHGDQAFLAVSDIVKRITKAVDEDLGQENEQELEKLRTALGMGAKGKGAQKALRGATTQLKELEAVQKKRKTRALRDALDLGLVDLAGLYRDALMLASGAAKGAHSGQQAGEVELIHPDMFGLSQEMSAAGSESLTACIDAIMECRQDISVNVRPETALDAMLGKIRLALGLS